MQWSDVPLDPSRKVLRQFAALSLIVLGSLACWRGLARGEWVAAAVLGTLALGVGLTGLLRPSLIRYVFIAAMIVTFPIGWLFSWVVLSLVYFGVFTPLAVAFRWTGRDALERLGKTSPQSYWKPKAAPADASRYLQQY